MKTALSRFLLFILFAFAFSPAFGADTQSPSVIFLADLPNPNDFTLFANNGWDGNWYVGYNTCWIQKLTLPAQNKIEKVFVGAKLGRMKNVAANGKSPWVRQALPGEVRVSIAEKPVFSKENSYLLVKSSDIPFEGDPENAVEGVGESQWFWREVPLKSLNFGGEVYVALWSPSAELDSAAKAPILAAGWGSKEVDSWLLGDVKGSPSNNAEKSLSTPVTIFEPAIALKLVKSSDNTANVKIVSITDGKAIGRSPAPRVVWAQVAGSDVTRAWIEISTDQKTWSKMGRAVFHAPYVFTLKLEDIPIGPSGKTWVRVSATTFAEQEVHSDPLPAFNAP